MACRRLKFAVFRVLEAVSALRLRLRGATHPKLVDHEAIRPGGHDRGSLWIFASTIGELNLIEPLLDAALAELPAVPLTLITDRRVYREAYGRKYPRAVIYEYAANVADTKRLARLTPPLGLLIVEIPCLLFDAPCRLPFALVHEVKTRGGPVALVNGWLYGYRPASSLDRLERKWFGTDYLRDMDLITVQSEETRSRLVEEGADPARVLVTGNTKFDAFELASDWTEAGKPSERMLAGLVSSGRPVVVAGCIAGERDAVPVIEGFGRLVRERPDALLVLAPRHPEVKAGMERIEAAVAALGLGCTRRSNHGDAVIGPSVQCLILDTFGELKDFYAVATVTFVGRNHNLLEPLSFGKPTTTMSGWEATYPSYPVYLALAQAGVVREVSASEDLASIWSDAMSSRESPAKLRAEVRAHIARLGGATGRTMGLLRDSFLAPVRARWKFMGGTQ